MKFFTFALLISSCPFSTPPSSRPMMTSTMAISTSVKPDCWFFTFSPCDDEYDDRQSADSVPASASEIRAVFAAVVSNFSTQVSEFDRAG